MSILTFFQAHLLSSATGFASALVMSVMYKKIAKAWARNKPIDQLIRKSFYGPVRSAGELVGYRVLRKVPDKAFSEEVEADIKNIGNILDQAWDEGVELGVKRARSER